MKYKIVFFLCLLFCFTGCNARATNSEYLSAEPVIIKRFDKALYELIKSPGSELQDSILAEYPQMLEVLGKGVLNMRNTEVPGFFDKLIRYYSEPTLMDLYTDALNTFNETHEIEKRLGQGFAYLADQLPDVQIPEVFMHVSGFNQNILVGDSLLSISIDKYLGYDYPLYQDFFYDYQRIKMQPKYIVPDYFTGWLMSEISFSGKENVLLDRMIYEGTIKYLVNEACPFMSEAELLGYTEKEYEWLKSNEASIWKTIVERKHLYTPDHLTTTQYFEEIPSRFFADEAPGNLGIFIGWRIISQYMNETQSTPQDLIKNKDAQEILTASHYKP